MVTTIFESMLATHSLTKVLYNAGSIKEAMLKHNAPGYRLRVQEEPELRNLGSAKARMATNLELVMSFCTAQTLSLGKP